MGKGTKTERHKQMKKSAEKAIQNIEQVCEQSHSLYWERIYLLVGVLHLMASQEQVIMNDVQIKSS